jgi:hypothetical protein
MEPFRIWKPKVIVESPLFENPWTRPLCLYVTVSLWNQPFLEIREKNNSLSYFVNGLAALHELAEISMSKLHRITCAVSVSLFNDVDRECLLLLGAWSHLRYIRGSLLAHLFLWLVIPTCFSRLITLWYLSHFFIRTLITWIVNTDELMKKMNIQCLW